MMDPDKTQMSEEDVSGEDQCMKRVFYKSEISGKISVFQKTHVFICIHANKHSRIVFYC